MNHKINVSINLTNVYIQHTKQSTNYITEIFSSLLIFLNDTDELV